MAKTTTRTRMEDNKSFMRLITSEKGATGPELKKALNRTYALTQYHLRDLAARTGADLYLSKEPGELTRYYLTMPKKAA